MSEALIKGFRVRLDLAYDTQTHMWVDVVAADRVRVGMDPLGVETSGTLAQVLLYAAGSEVSRGEPFGSLEAEKFVGTLPAPLSGRLLAVNDAVPADPGLVERDPYGDGWLVELAPTDLDAELADLTSGADAVAAAFAARVVEYRREGILAE